MQSEFNRSCAMATALLKNVYPEHTIIVTDHDPVFITGDIVILPTERYDVL
jgi:hypothetical protein